MTLSSNSKSSNPLCVICDQQASTLSSFFHYCSPCDYWFSTLKPHVEDTSKPDSEYELVSYEHTRASNYRTILRQLKKLHPSGSTLLEVGCADGMFLKLASEENGYLGLGIEPNTKMIAGNVYNQQIEVGFFPEMLGDSQNRYDMIALNCVFEHIDMTREMIENFKKYLKPNGSLMINVPVASGLLFKISKIFNQIGISYPFNRIWQRDFVSPHMHFFSDQSIAKLFAKHGFKMVVNQPLALFSLGGVYARMGIDPNLRFLQKVVITTLLYCYYPISKLFPDARAFIFQPND